MKKTLGKKKPAVLMVWDGVENGFKYAVVGELRTKAHWKKWAESAFEPPAEGQVWKVKIDNMNNHYVIMLVPGAA